MLPYLNQFPGNQKWKIHIKTFAWAFGYVDIIVPSSWLNKNNGLQKETNFV